MERELIIIKIDLLYRTCLNHDVDKKWIDLIKKRMTGLKTLISENGK